MLCHNLVYDLKLFWEQDLSGGFQNKIWSFCLITQNKRHGGYGDIWICKWERNKRKHTYIRSGFLLYITGSSCLEIVDFILQIFWIVMLYNRILYCQCVNLISFIEIVWSELDSSAGNVASQHQTRRIVTNSLETKALFLGLVWGPETVGDQRMNWTVHHYGQTLPPP